MEANQQTPTKKEIIINEYLMGGTTFRKLGTKYEVNFRTIYVWVQKFQNGYVKKLKPQKVNKGLLKEEAIPTDINQLQKELKKARLHNELLNAMIDIAEDQLKIDIRKKSGTKR